MTMINDLRNRHTPDVNQLLVVNLRRDGYLATPTTATLEWYRGAPHSLVLAVRTTATPPVIVVWEMSREMAHVALTTPGVPFGLGDVRMERGRQYLTIALRPPKEGPTSFDVPLDVAITFLTDTRRIVEVGEGDDVGLNLGRANWNAPMTRPSPRRERP